MAEDTKLKAYHHIKLNQEFKLDCEICQIFLEEYRNLALSRPMVDIDVFVSSQELFLYSDASENVKLGAGAVFDKDWWVIQWEPDFIEKQHPSIEYLELFGVVTCILM